MGINFKNIISTYYYKDTKAAPLAVFRILFGLVMFISIIRFWYNDWIYELYLLPKMHFHYWGFDFISVPGNWIYLVFIICGLSALAVSIGFRYRLAILVFFLSFTYIEMLDKTSYLNHYYFISVMSFIMIFLPAHVTFSMDAYRNQNLRAEFIPSWTLDIIKLMLAIVYIYAGAAKLNYDWMMNAMPLSIWLPTKSGIPLIGVLMHEKWMHYLFSWSGAFYDLFIVFFLMWKPTRIYAFIAVVVFHILTRILFPIGMFPYIMIASTLVFFDVAFHERVLQVLGQWMKVEHWIVKNGKSARGKIKSGSLYFLVAFMVIQLLFPLRSHLYGGNVFWHEHGYRFSWRVMLMEKTGYANFKIVDGISKKRFYVQNSDFLTPLQEKQMATQPDFILEYAQYLGDHFRSQGHQNLEVYVESYAALNGRKSQPFIDPNIDLLKISYSNLCNKYITPLNEK